MVEFLPLQSEIDGSLVLRFSRLRITYRVYFAEHHCSSEGKCAG